MLPVFVIRAAIGGLSKAGFFLVVVYWVVVDQSGRENKGISFWKLGCEEEWRSREVNRDGCRNKEFI